jgi:diguanylate cyclase (GGDEF)-like protein
MEILINTKTVILTLFALNIFLVLLLSIYQLNQKKERNIKIFTLAKVFQVFAFVFWYLPIFIKTIGLQLLFLGSEFLLVGIFFECIAIIMLINACKPRTIKVYIILLSVFSALYILSCILDTTLNFRIIIYSVFVIALMIYPVLLLLKPKTELKMHRMTGVIYLLMTAATVLRALVAGNVITPDIALQDKMQSYILFSLFMLTILANSGYLFLYKVRADMKLVQLANCDELTNILNRRAFNEISEKAIRYCARKNESVSFILFDIDNFKRINDTFGHYVGDTVLVEIATMVQSQIRAYDFFGRYGGDEFALFLSGASGPEAEAAARRLLTFVESKSIYNHTKLRATISIGLITVVPSSDTSVEALYQLSDSALYDAKQAGGNCMMPPVQTVQAGGMNGETS